MSIEAWADAARREETDQVDEHQHAVGTVQNLLEGNTDSETAASTISLIYEPTIKRDPESSPVGPFWGVLCDATQALCGNKELAKRLVDLVKSISKLPDVTDEHGSAIMTGARAYWRQLPDLSLMFREAIDIETKDDVTGDWDDPAVPLLNATTFGATYLALGEESTIGMPFHAECSLMRGVEVPCQTPEKQRRAAMYVPPAATWILLAGKTIYELCKNDYERHDGLSGPSADKWLWGKGRGYSLRRWALWKKAFGEIATTQGLKTEVKDIAAKAASEMGTIEGQMQ